MARLLLFAISKMAIINSKDGSLSVISAIGGLMITKPSETEPPLDNDAVVPFPWVATAFWRFYPEDEGKLFRQSIELISPFGEIKGVAVQEFRKENNPIHSVTADAQFFPIGVPGEYTARLSLSERIGNDAWTDPMMIAVYPIEVMYH
ncbi:MAG: hypothetical protein SFU56_19500 [Capsulimonadales bacterium]|nr:hypothetical protein [Capsulimonadales bacterium]